IFLRRFFPEDSPARVARRREIESGIAELSRRDERIASDAPTPPAAPQIPSLPKAPFIRRQTGLLLLLALVLFGIWYASDENDWGPTRAFRTRRAGEAARQEPREAQPPEQSDEQPVETKAAVSSERTDPSHQEQSKPTAASEVAAPARPPTLPAVAANSATRAEQTQT